MTIVYLLLGLCVVLLAGFGIALLWGKPWSIQQLYTRTFLKFALKGPSWSAWWTISSSQQSRPEVTWKEATARRNPAGRFWLT